MSIIEIIKNRRSIRKYKKEDIPYEKILGILEAARWAPSSGNLQNWYFIIVKDPEKREKISEIADQEFIKNAPVLIVVCSDTESVKYYYGEKGKIYAIQNIAAAIQNILLKAYEDGYGTCWIGSFDEDKIKELLGVPKNIEVHAIITLGIPDESPASNRKPLAESIFFEKWGNKIYKPELYPLMDTMKDIIRYLKEL